MIDSGQHQFEFAESVEPSLLAGLTAEQKRRLSSVLDDYLRGLERGVPPSVESIAANHPDLSAVIGPYLESLVGLYEVAGTFGGETETTPPAANSDEKRLGDFVLEREIGRGGMGVVYEARQISLSRRVALKVLPFAAVLDARQIARFKNEAQAAAQLQHPNIVPVYAVGVERGVHYYAMQLVDGQPLDRAIAQLRGRAGDPVDATASTQSLPTGSGAREDARTASWHAGGSLLSTKWTSRKAYFETVMRLGIQAAEALHAAHSFGVVHRDIKPSNLLLDAAGKLWVTDFGLARVQNDASLTQTGDIVGTRQYMSPEQAGGQAALVDQRTDIYSLGATLYELLTLRPAFELVPGKPALGAVDRPLPARIRKLQPQVPVDLETVVDKAMARERDERYLTAQELADDLRRLLNGDSPLAQRPSLVDRAAKWARRHRRSVAAAALLSAVTLAVLAVGLLVINRARARAERDYARAERYLEQAQETVDLLGSNFAQRLEEVPGAEQVRGDILAETLGYYQRFVDQAEDDPQLRADLATTHGKIGSLHDQMGRTDKAIEAHLQSRRLLGELAEERPRSSAYRSQLAIAKNNLAIAEGHAGQSAEAQRELREAIAIGEQLLADEPESSLHAIDLAVSHNNFGSQLRDDGDREQAEREFRESIRLIEALKQSDAASLAATRTLAAAYNNLAALENARPDSQSIPHYRRAAELQSKLIEQEPGEIRYQKELATTWNNLGAAQARRAQLREAADSYQQAIELQKGLLRLVPLDRVFRRDLAITYNNLGLLHARLHEPEDAERCFRNALGFQEQLVAEQAGDAELQSSLGGIYNNLGIVRQGWGKHQEAADSFAQAISHQRLATKTAPAVERYRTLLGRHYQSYSRALSALGKTDEALAMLKLAEDQGTRERE